MHADQAVGDELHRHGGEDDAHDPGQDIDSAGSEPFLNGRGRQQARQSDYMCRNESGEDDQIVCHAMRAAHQQNDCRHTARTGEQGDSDREHGNIVFFVIVAVFLHGLWLGLAEQHTKSGNEQKHAARDAKGRQADAEFLQKRAAKKSEEQKKAKGDAGGPKGGGTEFGLTEARRHGAEYRGRTDGIDDNGQGNEGVDEDFEVQHHDFAPFMVISKPESSLASGRS